MFILQSTQPIWMRAYFFFLLSFSLSVFFFFNAASWSKLRMRQSNVCHHTEAYIKCAPMCRVCSHSHTENSLWYKSLVFDGTGKWPFCPWITIYISVPKKCLGKRISTTGEIHAYISTKFLGLSISFSTNVGSTWTRLLLFMEIGRSLEKKTAAFASCIC